MRGVHHVELTVPNYMDSTKFYDNMFGWLGYKSFWTLGLEYTSTYYVAGFPFIHTYIGIQPATMETDRTLSDKRYAPGINHVALWARSKREVRRFHREFLLPEGVDVIDPPAAHPLYYPGYYAVFFHDPAGITWELAYTPRIPNPVDLVLSLRVWRQAAKELKAQHPEWEKGPLRMAWRRLPGRTRGINLVD
jgi:catechol 2,3-dioxygenase-like lactoylglutathione lyase family enzyme